MMERATRLNIVSTRERLRLLTIDLREHQLAATQIDRLSIPNFIHSRSDRHEKNGPFRALSARVADRHAAVGDLGIFEGFRQQPDHAAEQAAAKNPRRLSPRILAISDPRQ